MAGKRELKVEILGDASSANRALGSLDGATGKMGGAFKAVGVAAAGAGLAIVAGLKGAIDEAREAAKVTRQTEAVIKSTGGVAGVTADHISGLAEKLSNLAGVDDELIQTGENVLLTFTNIRNAAGKGNDIFDQATTTALDMSSALGTDLQGSIIQVGKALNDPIKGITALSRVGVSFTQQQKDQIAAMVKAGDVLGAQKVILKELGTEFGGAAEAAADPMQKLGVIVGNLNERVGTALLPVVEKAADWLGAKLPGALDGAAKAFGALQDRVDAWWPAITSAFDTVRGVVDEVVGFVGGLLEKFRGDHDKAAGGVSDASGKIKKLLEALRDTFSSLFGAIRAIIEAAVKVMTDLWDRFGKTLVDKLGIAFRAITDALTGAAQTLSGIFDFIKAILTGKWGEAWEAVKKILGGAWDLIGGVLRLQSAAVSLIFEGIKAAVSMIWSGMWNMLKTLASDAWEQIKNATAWLAAGFIDFFKKLPGRIVGALGDLGKILYDKGKELIGGFIDGIKDMAGSVADAVSDAVGGAAHRVGSWLDPTKAGAKPIPSAAAATKPIIGSKTLFSGGWADLDTKVINDMIRNGGTFTGLDHQTYGGATLVMPKPRKGDKLDANEVYTAIREADRQHGGLKIKVI